MTNSLPVDRLLARLQRFWFLLSRGMWTGWCAIDGYDSAGKLKVIGAGKATRETGVGRPFKIWWERK